METNLNIRARLLVPLGFSVKIKKLDRDSQTFSGFNDIRGPYTLMFNFWSRLLRTMGYIQTV